MTAFTMVALVMAVLSAAVGGTVSTASAVPATGAAVERPLRTTAPNAAPTGTVPTAGSIPTAGAAGKPGDAAYVWPLRPPPAVLTPFGDPANPFGPGHRGVDLGGAVGQPVLAARAGTVVFAGPVAGIGVVSVQHDDGLRTTYEPVVPTVRVGARVAAGGVLGTLVAGHPGCRSPCLHWGVRRDRLDYLDPLVLLMPPHVRLLPVPEPWPGG